MYLRKLGYLQLYRKTLYPKIRASMRWVTDVLVRGGTFGLHRSVVSFASVCQ